MINLYYPLISTNRDIEGKSMMLYRDEMGLCETCNYIYSCTLSKRYHQPVWQCEEFDDSDRTEENQLMDKKLKKWAEEKAVKVNLKKENQYLGLCANCKNRKSCTYPEPGEGISYCGEYE